MPLTFKINYVQKGFGTQGEPGGDIVDDGSKAVLASVDVFSAEDPSVAPFANSPMGRNKIETLSFVKANGSARSGASWDASAAGDWSITGYYTKNENDLYDVVIESTSNIYAPVDSSAFFAAMSSLKEINFNNFKTDDSINMSFMFAMDIALTKLDVSKFNTSKVTDMSSMFRECNNIISINMNNLDVSNVTTMEGMFQGRHSGPSNLKNIYMSGWNTLSLTNMSYMFDGCESLENLNINHFDTSKVTNMEHMFNECSSLTSLDLSTWDTSKVTNMTAMFQDCSSLIELKLNSADFSSVTTMQDMFHQVSNITIYVKDQAAIDFLSTTNVTNATYKIEPLQS